MGAPYFRFKQFTVWHDRCAMKVGTDGVLLGAWAGQERFGEIQGNHPRNILDIGTGSGLIALMLAQRFPQARITGIDCDKAGSPWADRLRAVRTGLQDFCRDTASAAERFDLIVSNPPFYDNTLTNPDSRRSAARHTDGLPHDELLLLSASLLSGSGVFSLIIPSESEKSILRLADRSRLYLHRITRVYSKPSPRPRRILASFGKQPVLSPAEDTLTLTGPDGHRSTEHAALTKDFYLYEQ